MPLNGFNKSGIALIALLIGVFALSFGSVFVRLSSGELSAYAIAADRLLIAAILFMVWQSVWATFHPPQTEITPSSGDEIKRSVNTPWLLLMAGVLWFASLASFFWAQTQTNIAIACVLHNLAPIFTSLGAWWFFGKTFNFKFGIGMLISLVGVSAIGWEEMQISALRLNGDFAAILSAVFLAAYLLSMEYLRVQLSAITIQLWICVVGASVSLPVLLVMQEQLLPESLNAVLAILALAFICQVCGHGLLTFSLDRLSSVVVALVHLLEPILAGLLAWIIFSEQLGVWSWVSFFVVLLGLYLAISSQVEEELGQSPLEENV